MSAEVKRFVAVVQKDYGILKMFIGRGWEGVCVTTLEEVMGLEADGLDLVCFSGGTDVGAELYDAVPHPHTGGPDTIRDITEQAIFDWCRENFVPMAGICRGSQFLCVMNGGHLKQHVENHGIWGTHKMRTRGGLELDVTSTHHQMMQPAGGYSLRGWAEGLSPIYEESTIGVTVPLDEPGHEPEAVLWYDTGSIAFQFHPEYMKLDAPAVDWFFDELDTVLFDDQWEGEC